MIEGVIAAAVMAAFIVGCIAYCFGYEKGARDERQHMQGMQKAWGGKPEPHDPEYLDPADWWKRE